MPWYIETSAAVKLLVGETHSAAMLAWASEHWGGLVSSDLTRTELLRTAGRADPALVAPARDLLDAFDLIPLQRETFRRAGLLPPAGLRSLDALHLTCALAMGSDLDGLVTYDGRLIEAGRLHAVTVVTPS